MLHPRAISPKSSRQSCRNWQKVKRANLTKSLLEHVQPTRIFLVFGVVFASFVLQNALASSHRRSYTVDVASFQLSAGTATAQLTFTLSRKKPTRCPSPLPTCSQAKTSKAKIWTTTVYSQHLWSKIARTRFKLPSISPDLSKKRASRCSLALVDFLTSQKLSISETELWRWASTNLPKQWPKTSKNELLSPRSEEKVKLTLWIWTR